MSFSKHLDLTMEHTEEVRCKYRFRPIIKKFGPKTHFSINECEALLIIFYKLTKNCPMDRKYFRRVMYKLFDFQNDVLIDRIFSAFDRNNKLVITMDSWILGLSIFLRGTLEEKIDFCFKVYDMMCTGLIKKGAMFLMLRHTFRGNPMEEDPDEVARDWVEVLMKKMDLDRDGYLSFQDYSSSVLMNQSLLEVLGYCFPARPAVYAFMTTCTRHVTTMHSNMYQSDRTRRVKESRGWK